MSHIVPTIVSHHPYVEVPQHVVHTVVVPRMELFGAQITALYTLLVLGPFMYESALLLGMNAALVGSSNALWLGLCSIVFSMLGAGVGAYLSKLWRNIPRIVGLGVLLMAPFLFAFWNCLDNKAAAESWFWTGLCLLSIGSFGFGGMLGGSIAYLGKTYRTSLSPHSGKVVGSFFWWAPVVLIFIQFIVYLLSTSLLWGIILAVIVVLVGVLWLWKVPTILP